MDSTGAKRTLKTAFSLADVIFQRFQLALFVCCIFLHNGAVNSQSSTTEESPIQITHEIGRDAVLTCTVKDIGKRRVIWSKMSDPYPISVGNTRFSPDRKYKVNAKGDSYILTIKNVGLRDAGEYQCRVSGQVFIAEIITLNIQAGSGNTYLIPTETEISAEIGATVLLPCHVENMNDRLALWKNSRNEVLTLRKKVYSGDRRYDVRHHTRPEWSLQIKNVRESDFGVYTCVINSDPVLTRTVVLKNSAPAQFAPVLLQDSHFRKRIEAKPGETVTMTCNFRAVPPAKVTWYRRKKVNGKSVKDKVGEGSTFKMESVTPEQSGNYICMGKNDLKPTGRGKTRLIVLAPATTLPVLEDTTRFEPTGPSTPQLYHHQEKTRQRRGRNVEIKCTAIGQPRPNIHWTRHGKRLVDDHKYKIETKTIGRHTLDSVLLVRSLSLRDFGIYECVGYNQLGMVRTNFEINEIS